MLSTIHGMELKHLEILLDLNGEQTHLCKEKGSSTQEPKGLFSQVNSLLEPAICKENRKVLATQVYHSFLDPSH